MKYKGMEESTTSSLIVNLKKMTIGNYTYLDGELHVRLSIACNCLITHLCNDNENTKVAFLCTPTDCHLIPKEAYLAGEKEEDICATFCVCLVYSFLFLLFLNLFQPKTITSKVVVCLCRCLVDVWD